MLPALLLTLHLAAPLAAPPPTASTALAAGPQVSPQAERPQGEPAPPTPSPEAFLRTADRLRLPDPHPPRAAGYDFAAGLYKRLAVALRAWPGHGHARAVGRSVDGRTLWAFTVRSPREPVRHRVLVLASLHALEWLGAEVAVALLERTLPAPPPGVALTVVPLANPDGRAYAEADLLEGRIEAYRRGNANGVDLNRDWSTHRSSDVVWSRLPLTRRHYFSSPGPLSQPETQALDRLAAEGVDVVVSLHAFGGYIYLPWSGRRARPDDYAQMKALGEVMAEAQPGVPYRVMQLSRWLFTFRALGSELDHMHAVHGAQSFLIELGRPTLRPGTWQEPFRWYNPPDKSRPVAAGVAALEALLRELGSGFRL